MRASIRHSMSERHTTRLIQSIASQLLSYKIVSLTHLPVSQSVILSPSLLIAVYS